MKVPNATAGTVGDDGTGRHVPVVIIGHMRTRSISPVVLTATLLVLIACSDREAAPVPTPTATATATATPTPAPVPTATPSPVPVPPLVQMETVAIPTPPLGTSGAWHRAVELFHQGPALQMERRLPEAIDAYLRSIEAYPTAEAYTFLGWTYSWMGQYERAIAEAKKAIEIDPDYGNPYNDIGTYLTELGRPDDAIPWLEKATQAKRYASPDFPHLNLARIWTYKGMWNKALASYEAVLLLRPEEAGPPLSAAVPPPFALDEAIVWPAEGFQLIGLRRAMGAYFEAWSGYDASALMQLSAPPSTTEAALLLISLAHAKRLQLKMRLIDLEARFLSEDTVMVRPRVQIGRAVLSVPYLLRQDDTVWKVVGVVPAWPWDEEGEPPPLDLIIGPVGPSSSRRA